MRLEALHGLRRHGEVMTLRTGDSLTLSNRVYTVARLDLKAGKVLGAWLTTAPTPDAGGDTIVGSTAGLYLTAAMLRRRLAGLPGVS